MKNESKTERESEYKFKWRCFPFTPGFLVIGFCSQRYSKQSSGNQNWKVEVNSVDFSSIHIE